jgi:two-component sensor histidine kinase
MRKYLASSKDRWKFGLAIGGLIIIIISLAYTQFLTKKIAQEEENKIAQWFRAYEDLQKNPVDSIDLCDYTLHQEIITSNTTIPAILVNDQGKIEGAINYSLNKLKDTAFLAKELKEIIAEGRPPVQILDQTIYYKHSKLLTLLKYYPLFQFLLISAFVGLGYLGFSAVRRSEQNKVWVGMAKETAHQLGTPISAIMGWVEYLRTSHSEDESTQEVLKELDVDISRLDLIADRFSKIGSTPELKPLNLEENLARNLDYMRRRASKGIDFSLEVIQGTELIVPVNEHLLDWVIENLLRNSIDAIEDGKGSIHIKLCGMNQYTLIELTDSGKGIPKSDWKTIFQPGFTTKKRGWGLGLSLSKRIIEDYHGGKIFVKKSVPKTETTFVIELKPSTGAART